MFLKKKNGEVEFSRGDTLKIVLTITELSTGAKYIPTETDVIKFYITKTKDYKVGLVEKVGTEIELLPSDTENLELGDYYYSAKIFFGGASDNVNTFIENTKWTLV